MEDKKKKKTGAPSILKRNALPDFEDGKTSDIKKALEGISEKRRIIIGN